MKKILYLLFAVGSLLMLPACSDVLDEDPKGSLYPYELLSDATLAETTINSLYGILVTEYRGALSKVETHGITPAAQRYISYLCDVPGEDMWISNTTNVSRTSIDMFTHTYDGNDNIDRMYYSLYKGIKDCNFVLQGLNKADYTDDPVFKGDREASERFIAQGKGQALAIRSYVYFYLTRLFGDVAVVPEEMIIEDDMRISRKPMPEVYRDHIIPDLLQAIDWLDDLPAGTGELTRITANACRALLAEVYLTMAGRIYDKGIREAFANETVKTRDDFYRECVRYCALLETAYELHPDFGELFTLAGNHSKESIWEVQTKRNQYPMEGAPVRIDDNFPGLYPYTNSSGATQTVEGYGRYCMANVLYELYDAEYDHRLDNVVEISNTYNKDVEPITTWRSLKYCDETIILRQKYSLGDSNVAWKCIRYAHVLLMRAEALNELGLTGEAAAFLDLVRGRAYKGNEDKIPVAPDGQKEFREFVWEERRKELFGECYRYFDMQRTNTLHYAQNEPAGTRHDIIPEVEEKHYLFPIPKIAFEYNPQLGIQNPGW